MSGTQKQIVISVASGKGGTGKTTVSTNLAVSLTQKVQLLDCDVEEPNAHLFLSPDFNTVEPVIAPIPQVDLDKCTFCRKCMDICRFGAIAVLKKDVMVFDTMCHSCGGCFEVCPEDAITEKKRSLGDIEKGVSGKVDFIHGKMGVGQVMAPPIIKKVRSFTDPDVVTIIDAPPGTSCPVIAAMNKVDFVLLVTEPTPFGLNDLILAVETVKRLGIPHGLVINRAGLGNDGVKNYAEKEGLPILMEIPFDKNMARIYSEGGIMAESIPGMKEKFQVLFEKIVDLANKEKVNQ